MEMESFMDELLNFSIPEEEEDEENDDAISRRKTDSLGLLNSDDLGVVEEEDLEWISNINAFPVIETFIGILPPEVEEAKQLSPISSSSTTTTTSSGGGGGSNGTMSYPVGLTIPEGNPVVPVKPRSKRKRTGRKDLRVLWTGNNNLNNNKRKSMSSVVTLGIGRKCQHCGVDNTPQWRAGPLGPKTLCNACGVRFKSGRLVPEYRPANSPTFSAELHSNSHRKIVEMRKKVGNDCG